MRRFRVSEVQRICTKAEFELLMAARPDSIGALSVANLRRSAATARRLRDKWSELATRQLRGTQRRQNSRVTDDNARSEEKAELFADALARFEARLGMIGSSAGAARIGRQVGDDRSTVAERARSAHEMRSVSRGRLNQMRGEFNAERGTAAPREKAASREPRAASPKPAPAAKRVRQPPWKPEPLRSDREQQREARGAAKRSQGRGTGMLTRSRGHILARGGRAQKKRDSR